MASATSRIISSLPLSVMSDFGNSHPSLFMSFKVCWPWCRLLHTIHFLFSFCRGFPIKIWSTTTTLSTDKNHLYAQFSDPPNISSDNISGSCGLDMVRLQVWPSSTLLFASQSDVFTVQRSLSLASSGHLVKGLASVWPLCADFWIKINNTR